MRACVFKEAKGPLPSFALPVPLSLSPSMPKFSLSSTADQQQQHRRRLVVRTEIAKHCCCKGKTKAAAIVTITEGKLKQVRRRLSRRRGWTTGEFDAHLAEWVSERGVEVKYLPESSRSNQRRLLLHHPLPRVDIAVETEALVASMKSTAAKEFQRVQTAVLRWVRRRCRKSKERWEVETSHMNDMKHNLSAATKAVAVQAVVALLAARGIVCIKHDREKAKGQRQPSSSSSDWVTKALQWAAETASWIDVGEVEELVRLAAKNINTASNDNKAIVELGCGGKVQPKVLRASLDRWSPSTNGSS